MSRNTLAAGRDLVVPGLRPETAAEFIAGGAVSAASLCPSDLLRPLDRTTQLGPAARTPLGPSGPLHLAASQE